MPKHARLTDPTIGYCSACDATRSGTITTASTKTFSETLGLARIGDVVTATCGHTGIINTGSSHTSIDERRSARIEDTFTGTYTGHIIDGSGKCYTT